MAAVASLKRRGLTKWRLAASIMDVRFSPHIPTVIYTHYYRLNLCRVEGPFSSQRIILGPRTTVSTPCVMSFLVLKFLWHRSVLADGSLLRRCRACYTMNLSYSTSDSLPMPFGGHNE